MSPAKQEESLHNLVPRRITFNLLYGYAQADIQFLGQEQSSIQFLQRKLGFSSESVRSTIVIDARVMHGNPVFKGTRIPLYQIIEELAGGTRLQELPESYPSLTVEQIQRGLDFAASLLRIYDD